MKLLILIVSFITAGHAFCQQNAGKLMDDRDLKSYPVVLIGDQLWMAKNLNYNVNYHYFYYLSGKETFYSEYNLLHDTLCPEGWRIPTVQDFNIPFDQPMENYEGFTSLNSQLYIEYAGYLFGGSLRKRKSSAAFWALTGDDPEDTTGKSKAVLVEFNKEEGRIQLVEVDDQVLASCRCVKY